MELVPDKLFWLGRPIELYVAPVDWVLEMGVTPPPPELDVIRVPGAPENNQLLSSTGTINAKYY